MSSMETALALTDNNYSIVPLQNVCTAVDTTVDRLEAMRYASGMAFDTSAFGGINARIAAMSIQMQQVNYNIELAKEEQEEYNEEAEKGTSVMDKLTGMVKNFAGNYLNLSTLKNVLGMSDELTQTTTQLDRMVSKYNSLNGTMQTTTGLSEMVYQSAQNARVSYLDTAAAVAKLGNNAGNAFSSAEEIVGFAELFNKQFAIEGLSETGAAEALEQFSQALGSGAGGDALSGIFAQAPELTQTVADYMGQSTESVRALAAEGQISADIVKSAMFAAEDEINAKFERMPMTWGDLWTMFQNGALKTFQPVLQGINELANNPQIQMCMAGLMNGLAGVAEMALYIIDALSSGISFIVDNWSFFGIVIGAIAAALALYNAALIIHNIYEAVSNGLKMLATGWAAAHAAATATEGAATAGAAATQMTFNAALLACPLTWIVIAIIAVIAAIYLIVAAINHIQGTTISATGIIAGLFAMLGANIINTFVIPAWNMMAAFVNFIGNVFRDPIGAVKVLFYDMALTVLGYISSMAHSIETLLNKIPGVTINITSGLDEFYNKLKAAKEKVKDQSEWVEYVGSKEFLDPETAYDKGYDWGQGVDDKVKSFFGGAGNDGTDDPAQKLLQGLGDNGGYGGEGGAAENLSNIANDTSHISDSLDVSQEDVKYLRDIAEQEAINRFTTADINVNMSGMQNVVNNTNDLDGIVDGLTTRVMSAMEVVRAGA